METVASLLRNHVGLRITSVDRIGIGGYIPRLQHEGGLVQFLLHRAESVRPGRHLPSPALLGHNHDRMLADFERFVAALQVPVVRFRRGDAKEQIARPYQLAAAAEGRTGVVLVGKAQERMRVWRGWKDAGSLRSSVDHPHFSFARQAAVPDHWYFYLWDEAWGPAFIKLSTYAPYGLWVSCNGHEWLKRQLVHDGVAFDELDNGLWRVHDEAAARRRCARLGSGHVRGLISRWLPILPSPLTAHDRRAGFDWAFSIRQLEISDTAVFDRPGNGRAWFEAAIRDHLDLGRPDNVTVVFGRRVRVRGEKQTPGRFATQVITPGVAPRIHIRYKSSGVKAYLKGGKALRVETTINNAADFDVRKTLNSANWRALRRTGKQVNARFLSALGEGIPAVPDIAALHAVVLPTVHNGQRAPGLRFGEPRVMGLFAALAAFDHVCGGLTNAGLRTHMADLFDPGYGCRQATYDLRRLRLKGLIERIDGTHTYRVTAHGHAVATFFTKLAARVVVPVLTELQAPARPPCGVPATVVAAWRAYDSALRRLLAHGNLDGPTRSRHRPSPPTASRSHRSTGGQRSPRRGGSLAPAPRSSTTAAKLASCATK